MNKKVAFYTLGCKLNYSETSSIGRLFNQAGYDTSMLFGAGPGSEAFDEPLSTNDTVAIANLFIV